MKNVEFTNLYLENFGRHHSEPIQAQLGKRVLISGANATGKSTIKRAFQFILGARDENGKEITGIRPHDENGVDIDGLVTTAEVSVSVDGLENTLKKTYFQKKNRQGEYTGENDTQYFIDDVRKATKKAYDEFVSGFLPAMVCISAQEFFSNDTAGRREMLSIFSKHNDDDVIAENPKFEELRAKVKANNISDLKKACRDKMKVKTAERDALPARIDEIERQKVDIDVAELELQKKTIEEQIAENDAKQEDISKKFAEWQKESDGVLQLKLELNGLEQRANIDLEKKRREIIAEIDKVDRELRESARKTYLNGQDIKIAEDSVKSNELRIQTEYSKWTDCDNELKAIEKYEFDENSLICSMCGQEYPTAKKEEIRADFDAKKKEKIEQLQAEKLAIEKRGKELRASIEKDKVEIEQLNTTKKKNEEEEINLQESIKGLETCLDELPESIDISDREDVKAIKNQIAEKEQAMNRENSASEIRQQLKCEHEELQSQLYGVKTKIALAQKNVEIDERVAELRKRQREISQEIADVDRELDLLKQFERKKAELLELDVNGQFDYVKFKMSELQVNGELKDVCQILFDGESYDRNLNHGARILAQIDICRAFQSAYGICSPIIVDDCESLDEWRMPEIPNQLILIRRTDEKNIKIEVVK